DLAGHDGGSGIPRRARRQRRSGARDRVAAQTGRPNVMKAAIVAPVLCGLLASSIAQAQEWSRFEWAGVDVGGRTAEKAGIYLPVTIRGLTGKYSMQLDTGSPHTLLYGVPYEQLLREQNAPSPAPAASESSRRYSHATFTGGIGALELD